MPAKWRGSIRKPRQKANPFANKALPYQTALRSDRPSPQPWLRAPLRRERGLIVPANAVVSSCTERSPLPLGEGIGWHRRLRRRQLLLRRREAHVLPRERGFIRDGFRGQGPLLREPWARSGQDRRAYNVRRYTPFDLDFRALRAQLVRPALTTAPAHRTAAPAPRESPSRAIPGTPRPSPPARRSAAGRCCARRAAWLR